MAAGRFQHGKSYYYFIKSNNTRYYPSNTNGYKLEFLITKNMEKEHDRINGKHLESL